MIAEPVFHGNKIQDAVRQGIHDRGKKNAVYPRIQQSVADKQHDHVDSDGDRRVPGRDDGVSAPLENAVRDRRVRKQDSALAVILVYL